MIVPKWSQDIRDRRDAFLRECRMRQLMHTQSWWAQHVWERKLTKGEWK